ncbi:MAG TPA: ABC transporter substrate-binding protein [Bacilli bacterium]
MKGLTVLFIALTLILTACGGGSSKSAPSDSPSATVAPTATPSPSASAEPETVDLDGRTIKIAMWWDGLPKGETAGEKALLAKIDELQQKYNCKIEFVNIPFEQNMDNLTTSILAGEPMADIAILEFKRAIAPIKQGLLLPMSEFTKATSDVNNEQKHMVKLPQIAGQDYSFTTPYVSVVGMYYNRDLFKKLSLPDPQDLYNQGQWNWDKFLEVAKQATRDTNNDGKIDTWGFAGWPDDAARHFGVTNGALFVNENDLTSGLADPNLAEALEFVKRIWNVENIVKVKTGNKMDWNETNTFKDGDVAMSINYDWNVGDLTFEVGVVPNPAGPHSDGKHTYANTAQNGYFIPKGVKDPQIVYQIFEEMYDLPPTEEYLGQDWLEARFKNEADIRMSLDHINGTGRLSLEEGIPDFPFYAIMDDIIKNNQSVSATLDKYKQAADSSLAKLK